jgi:hypothetical protein
VLNAVEMAAGQLCAEALARLAGAPLNLVHAVIHQALGVAVIARR